MGYRMKRVITQIGADKPEVIKYTGKNVCVAVLDSGIVAHPDLAGRIVAFRDFTGKKLSRNMILDSNTPEYRMMHYSSRGNGKREKDLPSFYDHYGHGTHVCGIIGGTGQASGGIIRGIAPGCLFVIGKVLDDKGTGNIENLCQAIDWVLQEQEKYEIRILNISIGVEETLNEKKRQMLQQYLKKAWNQGILVVASAGNNGPRAMTISEIGDCPEILTVGCHDGNYKSENGRNCEEYSSRGPGTEVIRKPEIVAPGTDILSCNARYYYAFGNIKDAYVKKSGTSMSAPVVAGAAAVLLEKRPFLHNDELKSILAHSAQNLNIPWNAQGYGMIHLDKAIRF